MRGPEVVRLQEILMTLGYDIGSRGPDGEFGPDTANAVQMFQRRYGLISDGTVGELETWPLLLDALKAKVSDHPKAEQVLALVDRREKHDPPGLYRPEKSPRVWTGEGDNVIRGVLLHQTGTIIYDKPRIFDICNSHIVVLRDGTITLVNPMEWHLEHAGVLSPSTIAIEFHGNMLGVHGDSDTVWNEGADTDDLTENQLAASEMLFSWLNFQFEKNGGKWEYVYAHRQCNKDRRADPGSEIWSKIGVKWNEWLGNNAKSSWDFTSADGLPIPRQWDPSSTAEY